MQNRGDLAEEMMKIKMKDDVSEISRDNSQMKGDDYVRQYMIVTPHEYEKNP